jgi:hypothetical protein
MKSSKLAPILSALVAVTPLSALAQAPPEIYVVKEGEDCGDVAEHGLGDRKALDVVHAMNPDLGPLPHHLRAGQRIKLPPKGPDAKISFVRNQVQALTPAPHPARVDEELRRGHQVSTLASSSAEVTFVDRTRLQLGEHTLVVILGDSSQKAAKRTLLAGDTTLLRGTLRAHLPGADAGAAAPAPVPVATPSSKLALGPGESQVDVDKRAATRLAVYHGESKLRAGGREVAVTEGYGAKAEQGGAAEAPKPLPPAPVWSHVPSRMLFTWSDAADVVGSYAHGPGPGPRAAQWRVQIARDAAFNDVVADATVPANVTRLEAKTLPAGEYLVRVAAIDAERFQGPYGATAQVRIAPVAYLPGAPPNGSEPGRRASLRVPDGLPCSIDGAAFSPSSGPIDLAPARAHVVRCAPGVDGAGAAELRFDVAQSRPVVFEPVFEPAQVTDRRASQRVVIRVKDGAGVALPVQSAKVEVVDGRREDPMSFSWPELVARGLDAAGAVASPLVPGSEPGTWVTTVEWGREVRQVRIRVTVNGVERSDIDLQPVKFPPLKDGVPVRR